MSEDLTEKQKRFADEYLISLNATDAYKKIYGIEDDNTAAANASRLLRNDKVSAYVKERQDDLSSKTHLTQQWVLEKLTECVHKSMQEEEIKKWNYEDKCMAGTGEYVYDSKGATKALELIGKHLGMFKDKLELSGEAGVRIINDIPRSKT